MKAESDEILQTSRQRRFLAAFAACGSLTQAARWAKIHRQTHYDWLDNDPAYKPAFQEAERRGARSLEDEAVRRAHEGIRKAVRYKGRIVGYETEYSDSLLTTLLKGNNPDKFKDRVDQRHSNDPDNPLFSIDAVRAFIQQSSKDGK
jgi:hypothetical protein